MNAVKAVLFPVLLAAGPALAHIELTFPTVRYANDGVNGERNKSCPCGDGAGDQFCGGNTRSDPNRSARVTRLRAGAQITVTWTETVGHRGRYRVAFDPDGADLADFNAHILGDVPDPSDGRGARSMTVTLPSAPCDRCTLQLIQDMNGNTADPVDDPTGDATYFQCADIVLEPPDAGTGGGDAGAVDVDAGAAADDAGAGSDGGPTGGADAGDLDAGDFDAGDLDAGDPSSGNPKPGGPSPGSANPGNPKPRAPTDDAPLGFHCGAGDPSPWAAAALACAVAIGRSRRRRGHVARG